MEGVDRALRRKSLKERLGFKGMGFCGTTLGLGPTTISVRDDDEVEEGPQIEVMNMAQTPTLGELTQPCVGHSAAATGMNLAAALAAERQFRTPMDSDNGGAFLSPTATRPSSNDDRSPIPATAGTVPGTPVRVPLMRLLEVTDGCDEEMMKKDEDGGEYDPMCCVCMGRKKGTAFIPCGHTFCRVCSREIWLNRSYCPLCNRSILEILDIY